MTNEAYIAQSFSMSPNVASGNMHQILAVSSREAFDNLTANSMGTYGECAAA